MSDPVDDRRALVIEDQQDLAFMFSQALQAAGFQTEIIADGQVALARLAQEPAPILVVLDLHLPGVSGVTILQHIRATPRLAPTPVIIATADPRMAEPLDTQVDLILLKPISFRQLRDLAIRLVGPSPTRPPSQPAAPPLERSSA
ncbi:MAG: response regulator [Chloroflexi bacterium]|nr:response regulator [Chloroflexota bacterium]